MIPKLTKYQLPAKKKDIERVHTVKITGRSVETSCQGKHAFRTLEFANRIALKMYYTNITKTIMDVYSCNFCRFYHIGHRPGTKRLDNDQH